MLVAPALLVLATLLVGGRCTAHNHAPVRLTAANYSSYTQAHTPALVMFYAPWCRHSAQLTPHFAAAAAEVAADAAARGGQLEVHLATVDAVAEERLAGAHGVASYPALRLVDGGVVADYEGPRDDGLAMAAHLLRHVRPAVQRVGSADALAAALAMARDTVIVAAFATDDGAAPPPADRAEWDTIVSDLALRFALIEAVPPLASVLIRQAYERDATSAAPTPQASGGATVDVSGTHADPRTASFSVHLAVPFCGPREECLWETSSAAALVARLQGAGGSFPAVGLLTPESLARYALQPLPLVVVYMHVDLSVNPHVTRYILTRLRLAVTAGWAAGQGEVDAAQAFRFAVADCRFWRHRLQERFGERECRQFFVTIEHEGRKYKTQALTQQSTSRFAATALLPFLRLFLGGEVAPYRKSETVRGGGSVLDNVVPVTADTLGMFVGTPGHDSVLMLYEPWDARGREKMERVTAVAEYAAYVSAPRTRAASRNYC